MCLSDQLSQNAPTSTERLKFEPNILQIVLEPISYQVYLRCKEF